MKCICLHSYTDQTHLCDLLIMIFVHMTDMPQINISTVTYMDPLIAAFTLENTFLYAHCVGVEQLQL